MSIPDSQSTLSTLILFYKPSSGSWLIDVILFQECVVHESGLQRINL